MTTRRQFSGPEKMQILRLHLLEHKPISEVCQQHELNPNLFYRWQQELFEHGAAAFQRGGGATEDRTAQKLQKEVTQLRTKLAAKDFKQFVRISGMTHVRTSPYYPQSNGKLERRIHMVSATRV